MTAAGAAEFTISPERLMFAPARWRDAQEVTLTARQDSDALADAPVQVAHAARGGDYDGVSGPALAVTTVEDDAAALAVAPVRASEKAGRIAFAVTLSRASDSIVTVDYATDSRSGTATEAEDYTPVNGTLRFPAQSTAPLTVAVTVRDDSVNEDTETFTVTLRNAAHAHLAGGGETLTAAARIDDDDPLPELSVGNGSAAEGSAGSAFEVRLSAASGRTVTVQFRTSDVTARGGQRLLGGERDADVRRRRHGANGHGADCR